MFEYKLNEKVVDKDNIDRGEGSIVSVSPTTIVVSFLGYINAHYSIELADE